MNPTQTKVSQKHFAIYQENDDDLITNALRCLEGRLQYGSELLSSSKNVSMYLQLQLAAEKNEVFAVIFLNKRHRLLAFEKLFYGTIDMTMVHPRVVVQKALEHNAASVILAHNHPSGDCMPSKADIEMTETIRGILSIIDVKTLDHFIVTQKNSFSFVEGGLL